MNEDEESGSISEKREEEKDQMLEASYHSSEGQGKSIESMSKSY